MAKNILLLGRTTVVLDEAQHQLEDRADIQLFGGTGIEDLRSIFAQANIDHVIIGGGLDLEIRLQMVRAIFELSETATVHMKNTLPRSEGFLPFVQSVLRGLYPESNTPG